MIVRMVLAAVVIVALGGLAASCNGDDGEPLTLEEYFTRVEEIRQRGNEESARLTSELGKIGAAATVDDIADSFEGQAEVIRTAGSEIDELDPPDVAEDAHDDFVDALNETADSFDVQIEEFRKAESVEEGIAAAEDDDHSAEERLTATCLALAQIAIDANTEARIDCEGG